MKKICKGCYALFEPLLKCKTLGIAIMLATLLIYVSAFQLQAADTVKDIKFYVRFENASFRDVLSYVEGHSKYRFFYNNHTLNSANSVTISLSDVSMDKALVMLLREAGLSFKIYDEQVVLKRKRDGNGVSEVFKTSDLISLFERNSSDVSNRSSISNLDYIISGKVTSETGEPLPGVNVIVKGTTIGTTTDSDGLYKLSIKDGSKPTLVFSFIGYKIKDIEVAGQTVIDISMEPDVSQLGEVVVVGYGTQEKVNLTGSVASIGAEELASRPITNISTALQGKLAGVTVVQQSGQPGRDGGIIRIRGLGTMNDAAPMVVVDGIVSSMEDLNPNDIESISVLKDASAGAIYGSRAANGVILVTTKKGKAGPPKISYNGYAGQQALTNMPEYINSYEYAKLLNEGLINEGASPRYSDEEIEKFRTGSDPENYPNTDWMSLLYRGSGFQQAHDINVSGGSETSRYFVSLGYLDQKGLVKKVNSDRYNIRFNLDSKVSKRLSIGLTSSFSKQHIEEPTAAAASSLGSIIIHAHRIPPTFLNKYPDGTYTHYIEGSPIAWVEEGGLREDNVYHGLTNVFAELSITDGLKLRGSLGADLNFLDRTKHVKDITYGDGFYQGPNSVEDFISRGLRTIPQVILTYQKDFKNHSLSGLLGASRESFRNDNNTAFRKDFPSNDLSELNAGALIGMSNSGSSYETRLESYFGRLNYGFKDKYLLELSIRQDGSSKFAENKRWGLFPSFSAGWRISEERFFKAISFINDLKMRVSYGSVGNNATLDYQFMNRIALGQNYPFGGIISSGAAQVSPSSPNLQWERSTTLDAGLDFSFLNGKFTFTGDYYNRYTDNILIGIPVSSIYGLPTPTVNGGAMRNKGFEFQLGYSDNVGALSYNTSFNIAFNKSKTEKFPNPSIGTRIYAEGHQWGAFYGYEYIGLYQTDEQVDTAPKVPGAPVKKGDLMFRDQNPDGKIDAADRIELGSDLPGVPFGLNLGLKYRNVDLSIFCQGAANVHQLLANNIRFPFINGYKAQKADLDRWTPGTPNAKNPITHVSQSYNYNTNSSFMTVNSSYVRLKNLQFGYTFNKLSQRSIPIERVRIYLSGQNIFTLMMKSDTEDRGFDPESTTSANFGYPNVKVFTAGLNVNF